MMSEGVDLTASRTRWSIGILIRRILWGICWTLLFRPSPRPKFDPWRCFLLRLFGARIGRGVLIANSVKVLYPWELEIGDGSWVGWDVDIYNYAKVTIGHNSVVSQYTYLCTGTHDYEDRTFPLIFFPIAIEDQAWVAAKCFVGPGITVGQGAIVASGSVVVKDVDPWTIWGGNPAKKLKDRPPVRSGE